MSASNSGSCSEQNSEAENTAVKNLQESYAKLLYELVPEIYRTRDKTLYSTSDGKEQKFLQTFLKVIAQQAGIIRDDIDKLLDNFFINTCEDWAIPYIGELVGANLEFDNDPVKNRIDVKNTVHWRRRKGTIGVVKDICKFVTGRNVITKEFFKHLVVSENINYLKNSYVVTTTPDLRNSLLLEEVNNGLDNLAHIPDVRNPSQPYGKYNIKNLGIFISRLMTYKVIKSEPFNLNDDKQRFFFQPSANNMVLRDAGTDQDISIMEFASNPHKYSSSERGANIYLNGVRCSSGYFDATSLTQKLDSVSSTDYQVYQPRGSTSGTSIMRQSFLGTPNFVNLHQTDGIWLLEPRKFDNRSRPKIHFEITAMLKDRINNKMVELGRLDTLDEGKFTFSNNTTVLNNADFLLGIKTATDSLPNTFPPTVIGIRNNDLNLAEVMPSPTNNLENGNLESIFKNALYVYLPEVFLDRNEVIYLYVSVDGSTYFANTSLSKKGEPDLDLASVMQTDNIAAKSIGQIYPPRKLTISNTPLTGFQSLNMFHGLKLCDISRFVGKALKIDIFNVSKDNEGELILTPENPMATLEINNPTDNNNGSLPKFIYNTGFDKQTKKDAYSTLIFDIQQLDGSHDPVFPISEITLTNSDGQTVLLYFPEIRDVPPFSRGADSKYVMLYAAEDGSMYSAEAHGSHNKVIFLLPNHGPKGAYRGKHLLRKSAGQVLPMTATIPLRHRVPLYTDLSRWDEQGFIGPLAGELAIDPIHGRFMVPKSDHQFQHLSTTGTIIRVDYNYGFTDDIGAGTYDRSSTFSRESKPSTKYVSKDGNFPSNLINDGTISNNNTFADLQAALDAAKENDIIQINDSCTYVGKFILRHRHLPSPAPPNSTTTTSSSGASASSCITIQTSSWQRPTLKSADGSPFIIDCGNSSNKTILNGLNLEVGLQIEQQQPQQDRDTAVDKHTATSQNIELNSCTIVPGKNKIAINLKTISSADTSATTPATTTLATCIKVNQCIMGAIRSNSKNLYLDLNRSIVHFSSSNSAELAIGPSQDAGATTSNPNEMPHKPIANIKRCTIVGKCSLEKLYASESIFTDIVVVEDQQEGCFRFSRYEENVGKPELGSIIPHRYKSTTVWPIFNSQNPSSANYLQLHLNTPQQLLEGSELGYEMGCYYNASINMIEKKLIAKIKEYLPVGAIPVFTFI